MASNSRVIRSDFKKLNNFIRALETKDVVRIGIMGAKGNRNAYAGVRKVGGHKIHGSKKAALTNAEIGAIMEFGSFSRGIPMRSFLRMPLMAKSGDIIRIAAGGLRSFADEGVKARVLKRMGIAAENAIQDAFDTGGFGRWAKLAPATIKAKHSSAILIDSAQLRFSVSSMVVHI